MYSRSLRLFKLAGQGYPYPVLLPTILHQSRVHGLLVLWLAVVAYDGDELV